MANYSPVVGDSVEYTSGGQVIAGILVDVWDSQLTGNQRAHVVDSWAEREDPEAGKQVDYLLLRHPL